ncbi:hypothetical protein ebA2852 [Aromatoleum aromaticum EbN1]|uniref:Uncharacterized protein n=1 Tax=Aromatoleum aromaticum (strain DSM 19018 / LMG 30748 / EbN1) TaxID=76114 RepID=Q5P4N4_AROAE|nr:hypothetical protein ebA2852 [Aromatoleum aromaticum EbN1]
MTLISMRESQNSVQNELAAIIGFSQWKNRASQQVRLRDAGAANRMHGATNVSRISPTQARPALRRRIRRNPPEGCLQVRRRRASSHSWTSAAYQPAQIERRQCRHLPLGARRRRTAGLCAHRIGGIDPLLPLGSPSGSR